MYNYDITIKNLEELNKIAHIISQKITNGSIIFLDGDLGAGKTTFSQFLGANLNIKQTITSPTFNILKQYQIDEFKSLNHFDIYRIESNVYDLGFEDLWFSNDITLIEWATYLPEEFKDMFSISINLSYVDETTRKMTIISKIDLGLGE